MAPAASMETKPLNDLINSTFALLKQFRSSLTDNASPTPIENAPNPLSVLKDSATLLKAHTTKISLLAINRPFTPSAIIKVLRELSGTCLPAMMSAVQICSQEQKTYTKLMANETKIRVQKVFKEIENLLAEIQSIARGESGTGRDSLSSTGVVWEACDALIELEKMGIAGLALKKAEQYRDSIKDAIEELQEWREGTDLDNEGEDHDALLDSGDEGVDGDTDSIEDLFNAANSCPKDRPELKDLVEKSEGRLKKVVFLYTALGKRRFKTYKVGPGGDEGGERLDKIMEGLKQVQSEVDELASCFYDLDEDKAKAGLEECVKQAKDACAIARLSWTNQEDEFTAWSKKWEEAVG